MRVLDENARLYYLKEASDQNWGVRQLERNINTLYYQRLLSSQNRQTVEEEIQENTKDLQYDNRDFIRNPSVLEFLNVSTNHTYTEKQLEQSLIDNLKQFLLELGKGFAFVARQNIFAQSLQIFLLIWYFTITS